MIHAGAMLDALAARAEVAVADKTQPAPWLATDAASLVGGVARCCFAHGRPGFLARSVCRDAPELCYPATSRDQITMAVFGLWRLLRSPLASVAPAAADDARRVLAAIADFLLATVTEASGWEAPTLDGAPDPLHRCVMWGDAVYAHEAARLPMVYAAAFAATGEERFAAARDRFAAEAVRRSSGPVVQWTPTYALLQMQASLSLLAAEVPALQPETTPILERIASLCGPRQSAAFAKALAADHSRPAPDWRAAGGLNGPYRDDWAALREVGEATVARQLAGPISPADIDALSSVLRHADPSRATGCGLCHIFEALYRWHPEDYSVTPLGCASTKCAVF